MRQAILFGLALSCGGPAPGFAEGPEMDHSPSLSVVQIRAAQGQGRVFFGSGVVIGPNRVATNCHVVRNAYRVTITKGSLVFPAVSQQVDTRRDLCVLHAPELPFPAARLGPTDRLTVGQLLHFYGYPHGVGIAFAEGRVEALHPFEGSRVIETSADFTFGGSGGGFFDEQGRLVGLATFLTAGQTHGYAIPSEWIACMEARASHRIEPLSGLTFWEDTEALPAFLRPPGR
ncbi:S1 family peptidase [Candidatus Methylocalor cossyra]|uniref:Trypsin-like peptidase domain-containing protein n=1 Tax=Candidatus Methylocalor cossyra TaxID=3108543 RepID=A0ABM9NLT5_9GAMM